MKGMMQKCNYLLVNVLVPLLLLLLPSRLFSLPALPLLLLTFFPLLFIMCLPLPLHLLPLLPLPHLLNPLSQLIPHQIYLILLQTKPHFFLLLFFVNTTKR